MIIFIDDSAPGGGGGSDPNFSNVVLLAHMNGTNGSTTFPDSSSFAVGNATTSGNAQVSTAQSKFGGASALFDGDGDQLQWSSVTGLGSGNWTVEFWCRHITNGLFSTMLAIDAAVAGILRFRWDAEDTNKFSLQGVFEIVASTTHSLNTWYHVAAVRNSGTVTLYIDGVSVGSTSNSSNFGTANVYVGGNLNTANSLSYNGYIDDLRITRNVARYTSNFTPPSAQFPDA